MDNETGKLRSYLQTIAVIFTPAGVLYMIPQSMVDRDLSNDARDVAEVAQTVLTGGEVSEALLIAELSSDRLEELKSRGVISCAEGTCSVDAGVVAIAQDAAMRLLRPMPPVSGPMPSLSRPMPPFSRPMPPLRRPMPPPSRPKPESRRSSPTC